MKTKSTSQDWASKNMCPRAFKGSEYGEEYTFWKLGEGVRLEKFKGDLSLSVIGISDAPEGICFQKGMAGTLLPILLRGWSMSPHMGFLSVKEVIDESCISAPWALTSVMSDSQHIVFKGSSGIEISLRKVEIFRVMCVIDEWKRSVRANE